MAAPSHRPLIIEDDPATADMLVAYLSALGHSPRVARTLEEVEAALREGPYCYVLADKQIPKTLGDIPLTTHGDTAQKLVRASDPRRNADDFHILQILVVTGFANDSAFIAKNFRMGASDFIEKPFDAESITAAVVTALAHAGRADHAHCASLAPQSAASAASASAASPARAAVAANAIHLTLDGAHAGKRTSFLIEGQRRDLQNARFAVLFQMAVVRFRGSDASLSGHELGIHRAPEIPSRIREAVAGVVPDDFLLIQSTGNGMFRLHPLVVVDAIDFAKLEKHAHPVIQRIASEERKRRG